MAGPPEEPTHLLDGRLPAAPQSHQQDSGLLVGGEALLHVGTLHAVAKTFGKRAHHVITAHQGRVLVLDGHGGAAARRGYLGSRPSG